MKRIILLLVGLLLTGCNQAVGNVDLGNKEVVNDKALKLGIIQFAEHSSLDATREGFVEELEEMGYELEIDYVNVQSDLTLILLQQSLLRLTENQEEILQESQITFL